MDEPAVIEPTGVAKPLAPYFVGYTAGECCRTHYLNGLMRMVPLCPYRIDSPAYRPWFMGVTDSASDRHLPPPTRRVFDAPHR